MSLNRRKKRRKLKKAPMKMKSWSKNGKLHS